MDLSVAISIVNIVVSGLLTVALFYVGSKASKIDQLEDRLRSAANEAVDLRFGKHAAEMASAMTAVNTIIAEVQRRLADGDAKFDADGQERHKLELKTLMQVEQLKGNCVKRDDLRRVEQEIVKLQVSVGNMTTACRRVIDDGGRA